MKKLIKLSLIICCFVLLTACRSENNTTTNSEKYSDTKELMGTFVSLDGYGANAEQAIKKAFTKAFELENIFSYSIPESELNIVNNSAFNYPVAISDDLFAVLDTALQVGELSQNSLNISMGNLITLWGIGTDKANLPSAKNINSVLKHCQNQNIILDCSNKTVRFKNDKFKIHLGAIAKGYIADELKKIFLENGVASGIINLGGNVLTVGAKPDNTEWKVAITDPFDITKTMATVKIKDYSVVTSGDYDKYFEQGNKRYHHILDPKNGYPTDSLVSTTIITKNSAYADALSTATFVLGAEEAVKLIESLDDTEAVFIDKKQEIYKTSGFDKFLHKENS